MKINRFFAILFTVLLSTSLFAETDTDEKKSVKKDIPPRTLIDLNNSSYSGYFGVDSKYTRIGGNNSFLAGGKGGLIINDTIVIGGGGYGLVYPVDRERLSGKDYTGLENRVGFGYGGFMVEYYTNPKDLVHFSAGILIGGGKLDFYREEGSNDDGGDSFFAFEPGVNLLVNVTRFCRIGAGVSYRYIYGIDADDFSNRDFRGGAVSVTAQFGWF